MKFSEYCQWLVAISDRYILKRWTKDIDLSFGSSSVGDVEKVSKKDIAGMRRRRFRMMKDKIASEVGPYYVNNSENEVGSSNIKDSVGRRAKGEHNIKKKNIVEINCNPTREEKECFDACFKD
ncbi:hypothetical protein M9H77_22802 [Catharanthus roseus]|uniref:Uncharacterized protein n=1 Tax=Catharanthus roseus TaxID=4058 RepID=A0ACC0ATN6_CATRO|nr:hypothetical protein M9H77_22802 [Catharanthus roseus]